MAKLYGLSATPARRKRGRPPVSFAVQLHSQPRGNLLIFWRFRVLRLELQIIIIPIPRESQERLGCVHFAASCIAAAGQRQQGQES